MFHQHINENDFDVDVVADCYNLLSEYAGSFVVIGDFLFSNTLL